MGIGLAAQIGAIRGANKMENRAQQSALESAQNAEVLDENKLKFQLQTLKDMGKLTPEMEQEILQEASGMNHISTDPVLRQAQMSALTNIERRGKEGLTLEDRAAAEQINRGIQQEQRAGQEAVMQNMQARGQLGSGGELAARLAASQSGADQARQQGSELARQSAAQRLQAQMSAGQMGGDIRQQDFGEQSQKAQAQDLINRFNTSTKQGVQSTNVGNRNAAQEANLNYAKALEQNRVDTANEQGYMNRDAYQNALASREMKRQGVNTANMAVARGKDKKFNDRIDLADQMEGTAARVAAAYFTGGSSEAGGGGSAIGGKRTGGQSSTDGGQSQSMNYNQDKKTRQGYGM
jgi:hypothetical protein